MSGGPDRPHDPDDVEALRREIDRWRAMANQHPALLWISDETGMCTDFNDAWLAFRGRTLGEEYGTGWLQGVHPQDADSCMATYLRHFEERTPFEMEYRLRRHDGEFRMILDAGAPWYRSDGSFAGFVGSCLDITDHLRVRQMLTQTEDLYRATIEALREAVIVTDGEGRIMSVNSGAAQLMAEPEGTLLGQPLVSAMERFSFADSSLRPVAVEDLPFSVALTTGHAVVDATVGIAVSGHGMAWYLVSSRPLRSSAADEVHAVVTSFVDVSVQKAEVEQARHDADHDDLTGLLNRAGLASKADSATRRRERSGSQFAIAYCDVDNLKVVNDTLGHAAGDALLRAVGSRISATVRSSDIVARVGGDELVVLLSHVDGLEGARAAAENLRAAVAQPMRLGASQVVPSVSIGVALMESADDLDRAIGDADTAMYAAKAAGRDRVVALG